MDRDIRTYILFIGLPAVLLTVAGLLALVFGVSGFAAELKNPDRTAQLERYERNVKARLATRFKAYRRDGRADYLWRADALPWGTNANERTKYGIYTADDGSQIGWIRLDDGGAIGYRMEPFVYVDRTRLYLIGLGVVMTVLLFLTLAAGAKMLAASARRARADLELQNTFLDMVSHELNTPLASIVPLSSALAAGKIGDGRNREEALRTVSRESARMARMIEELLTVVRLKNGRLSARKETVDLRDPVRGAAELARMRHPDCEIVFEEAGSATALADRDKVEQVTVNLIDNACRYAGGRVSVKCAATGSGNAAIRVEDRGPGIGAADRKRIFEKFFRASADGSGGGLGLGLYIVSEFTALMGGSVRVEDRDGGGCAFTVELPGDGATAKGGREDG